MVRADKCQFCQKVTPYLGHNLTENGLAPDSKKIEAVKNATAPRTIRALQQFLGLTNYYRRFIKDYAQIATPLTALLQKETPWHWDTNSRKHSMS